MRPLVLSPAPLCFSFSLWWRVVEQLAAWGEGRVSVVVKFGLCLRGFRLFIPRPEGVILHHRNTFINKAKGIYQDYSQKTEKMLVLRFVWSFSWCNNYNMSFQSFLVDKKYMLWKDAWSTLKSSVRGVRYFCHKM